MVILERTPAPAAPGAWRYPLAAVTYGAAEIAAVDACLQEGRTTMGPRVAAFEQRFADFLGARHAVMVNSGSSADLLCAFALGTPADGETEEVLVPAVTWPTHLWACVLAGYAVRLVDVDPATLQMDPADLERQVTPRTRAVFLAHILGSVGPLPATLGVAERYGLAVLEDCCEALGATWGHRRAGTFGLAGAFSFFFSHVLTTMEGGMVVTDDAATADRVRLWRSHGWRPKGGAPFHFPTWGLNLRPTELQGAFGLAQMDRLDGFLAARERNYTRLAVAVDRLVGFAPVRVPPAVVPSWHAFPLVVQPDAPFARDALCAYLEQHGVETRPLVAGNIARQPGVAHHPRVSAGPLPGADALHERACYIGLASHDDPAGTGYVAQVLADFVRAQAGGRP